MSDKDLFYIFGIALAISAVLLTFAGLKLKNFPGRAFPVVILWFVVLVLGATTFAVRESQHEAHAREAEHHETESAEEASSGPYENEGGALGGETEEGEEEAEQEAEGSEEEEPVGETEGTSGGGESGSSQDGEGGAEASTTLQLAADPTSIAFDKPELLAKPGKVTIDFSNPSAIPHNVVILGNDGKELAGTPEITEGKESVSTDLEAGEYTFVCTVPGHEEAGMVGTLTVE